MRISALGDGTCMAMASESEGDRSLIRQLLTMRLVSCSASGDAHQQVVQLRFGEVLKHPADGLAESLYTAMRVPGMRRWDDLIPSERANILSNTEIFLSRFKQWLQER